MEVRAIVIMRNSGGPSYDQPGILDHFLSILKLTKDDLLRMLLLPSSNFCQGYDDISIEFEPGISDLDIIAAHDTITLLVKKHYPPLEFENLRKQWPGLVEVQRWMSRDGLDDSDIGDTMSIDRSTLEISWREF